MKRPLLFFLPLALLSLFAGVALYQMTQPKDEFVRSALIGKPMPQFTLPAATPGIEGLSNIDFADGKPRLLNLFGSWCAPCKAEAPFLEALKERGVEIHGIALRDKPEDVAQFLKDFGNPFGQIGSDFDMRTQILLGATGVPETYVIDGKGIIVHQHIGDIREEHIPMLLQKLEQAK